MLIFSIANSANILLDTTSAPCNNFLLTSSCEYIPQFQLFEMSGKVLGMNKDLATILVPTIVTIIVFLLGQILVWFRDQKGKVAETKNYRSVIFKWIASSSKSIKQFANALHDFVDRMSKSENMMPEALAINLTSIDKLKDLKIDSYIKTLVINSRAKYVTRKKSDENHDDAMVFKLVSQIDFLCAIRASIRESYDSYQKQILALQKEWNKNLNALKDTVQEETVLINGDTNHSQYELQTKVLDVFNEWSNKIADGYSPVDVTINKMVNPLLRLISSETNKGRSNQYTLKMFMLMRNLLEVSYQWGVLKPAYIKVFGDVAENVDKSYDALIVAKDYFEKDTLVKCWWKVR
jgi:hypothetical protein